MSKLLYAGFARMLRNKVLLVCLGLLGLTNGISPIVNALSGTGDEPEAFLQSGLITLSVMTAVLTASFLGAEHRYGTLRNKFIVGHGRMAVYSSSFLICFAGMLILFAELWILSLVFGNLLMGGFTISSQEIWTMFLRSFLAMTCLTTLYTAIGLCIQSKSISSVTAVICAFMIMIMSIVVIQMLMEPEYLPADQVVMIEGITYEPVPDDPTLLINPDYLSGTKREVYQAFNDMSPVAQMLDLSGDLTGKMVLIPIAEIAVLMTAGLCIFKKRDIK